jgi:hypothetical protein
MSMIVEHDGILEGPFRHPVNPTQDVAGSIHNDATAQELGFRGGTIAGSIHMEQFPPLLLHAFGERWFERGSLSLYFLHATTHREPVRCLARRPEEGESDPQVEVWMEAEDGTRVCEGTAAVGSPAEPTALRRRLEQLRAPGELRMLAGLTPGTTTKPMAARVSADEQRERVERVTEPLDRYSDERAPVATAAAAVQALRRPEAGLDAMREVRAVGLFGAIELAYRSGPIRVERDYEATGRVLAVGETPKTEYLWYESTLSEPDSDDPIAQMLMMLRFMKGSSPLWRAA